MSITSKSISLFVGNINAWLESKFGRLQCDPYFVEYVELFKRMLSATEPKYMLVELLKIWFKMIHTYLTYYLCKQIYTNLYVIYSPTERNTDIGLMNIQYILSRAKMLARFVARQMSGVDSTEATCIERQLEVHLKLIKECLETSVIPLGQLRVGSYLERALLFKAIADRICLPAALIRGEYGVSWVEIAVPQVIHLLLALRLRFLNRLHLCDLMHVL